MITVDQALSVVMQRTEPLGVETIPLEDAAGRVLAEEIRADIDMPPFDRARMDGYAVRSIDVTTAPAKLRLIGEISAGASFDSTLQHGEAVKIFTGAPVPPGADSVQKVEVTASDGSFVTLNEPATPGQFITPRASEVASGDLVAGAGLSIDAAAMAALASFGYSRVKVGVRPSVAVLSTGSELVEVSQRPSGAQIRNSNSYTIAAYAARAGAIVSLLGTVEDRLDATRDALLRAAESRDVVITSGGVSMGDYDLVKAALAALGAEIYFDKVIIRPGKPTVFARLGRTYFFGLPGNPVSTSVTFNVFARPALRKMQGDPSPHLPRVRAVLARPVKDASSRRSFLPARLYIEDGLAMAEPLKWGGSSDLVAFLNANALIISPEDTHDIQAGDMVQAMLLGDLAQPPQAD